MPSLHVALLLGLCALMAASQSDLTLVRTIDLRGDTHHVQGIDFDERHVWVTSVDTRRRRREAPGDGHGDSVGGSFFA
jgi:hypothetical protein